jgi:hypothetical protein
MFLGGRGRAWALGVVAAGMMSGCSYVATTRLDYSPADNPAASLPRHTVLVVPLQDERAPRSFPNAFGHLFLTYVPLIPYVTVSYERLDESLDVAKHDTGEPPLPKDELFPTKMAKAIANDLRGSELFSDVQFGPEGSRTTDYVLTGTLRSTQFDLNATSYMLGMAGVLLWFVPIPVGSDVAEVRIDLALRDRQGNTVWQFPLQGSGRGLFTMYSPGAPISSQFNLEIDHYGSNDKGIDGDSLWAYHADALRSGMGEAKASLSAFLNQTGSASHASR